MQGAAHFIHQQMGCNTFLKHLCAPPGHQQHLSASPRGDWPPHPMSTWAPHNHHHQQTQLTQRWRNGQICTQTLVFNNTNPYLDIVVPMILNISLFMRLCHTHVAYNNKTVANLQISVDTSLPIIAKNMGAMKKSQSVTLTSLKPSLSKYTQYMWAVK